MARRGSLRERWAIASVEDWLLLALASAMLVLTVAGVVSRFLPQTQIARLDLLLPNLRVWSPVLGAT